MIRILLADDQSLLLSALATILGAEDDITVAATAVDGAEAVEKARAHRIDIAVLDIRMPVLDGIAAARAIMEMGPRVIMLTTFDDDVLIHSAIDAGVHGFLLKSAEPDVLAGAVRAVAHGESVLAPAVTGRVMQWVRGGVGDPDAGKRLEELTARERDVLAEIGRCFARMRWSALTIVIVLSLAYVMNFSGQTVAMGTWVAGLGAAFVFLSPVLGWLGTAVTGSDTSANALFSTLQQTAATNIGADPALLVAANTSGGVVGKMISPQSLAIAATAVQMEGKESEIFKKVVGWSFGFLIAVCVIVFLQSNVLSALAPVVP